MTAFVQALTSQADLAKERASVRIESSPRPGLPPVGIIVPVGMLRKQLDARLPLADLARDLPPGRRRRGWKQEFLQSFRDAAREMPVMSDEEILSIVKQSRRMRGRPEIAVAARE